MSSEQDFNDIPMEPIAPSERPAEPEVVLRPRVWTVFVAYVAAVIAVLVGQTVFAIGLVVWILANGGRIAQIQDDIMQWLTDPLIFLVLLSMNQIALGFGAMIPAAMSREGFWSRLAIRAPAVPLWGFPFLMLGCGVPVAIGVAMAYGLEQVLTPDRSFEMFFAKVTWPLVAPVLLFISLAPGFMEELFFRGYMQRRLLQRWSPWIAISISSLLFAVIHMMPHQVLFVIPVGIWLGVLAWRSGSVWPGIVCHAFINFCGSGHELAMRLLELPEVPPLEVSIALGILVFIGFTVSIWLLWNAQE